MDQEYLTIKEAVADTGKAEETIRRWVRSVRNQFQIDLDDTNEQLKQKTPLLRKQNESNPDGSPRKDKNGLPVFDWLLQRVALEESFQESPTPPHEHPQEGLDESNDDTQARYEDALDPTHPISEGTHKAGGEGTHGGGQSSNDNPQEDTQDTHEDTNATPQEEYIWMPRGVYEGLLAQLEAKDTQLERKDNQIDAGQERSREQNILLHGYQEKFGLLPAPSEEAPPAGSVRVRDRPPE